MIPSEDFPGYFQLQLSDVVVQGDILVDSYADYGTPASSPVTSNRIVSKLVNLPEATLRAIRNAGLISSHWKVYRIGNKSKKFFLPQTGYAKQLPLP